MGAMNEFKVLDPNGHTRTAWDTASPEEIEHARRVFDELMKRGYRAFPVDERSGGGGPQRSAFDPRERETLLVPPIRAG